MQLKAAALAGHLKKTLSPVYFVTGDETLLVEEVCDDILSRARSQGFSERSVHHVEAGFKWHDLLQDAASLSLFAERRIIDLRNPSAKFEKEASEVLRTYCESPAADTLLLLRCPRLDGRQKTSAWFRALDEAGVIVQIWPIGYGELPRWLQGRLSQAGVALTPGAVGALAERVEGNLLAAVQEIEKLRLAGLAQPVTEEALLAVMEDSSHYGTFDLLDAVYAGDRVRVARMVRGLRTEGVAVFAILGALTSQLRMLQGGGGGRMPPQRRRQLDGFLSRLGRVEDTLDRALAQCALVDQQGKGQLLGDPWLSLESLLLRLAGVRLPSLEASAGYLTRP